MDKITNADTPRTNAQPWNCRVNGIPKDVPADFARSLERELNAEKGRMNWLERKVNERGVDWLSSIGLDGMAFDRPRIDSAMEENP